MFSDYRAFGVAPSFLTSTAGDYSTSSPLTGAATPTGFIHLLVTADAVLSNVVFRYPVTITGVTQATDLTLSAGMQIPSIKSFTLVSGQVQMFFFKG